MGLLGFLGGTGDKETSSLPPELRNDNLKFKVIVENIEEGVILVDDRRVIQLINPSAATLCGWKQEEASGLVVESVMQLVNEKGEPYPDTEDPFKQVFSTGKNIRVNTAFLMTRDKQQTPIRLNLSPLMNQNKEVSAVVAVMSNVSEERAEEQQRADFISTASHEMRTPVAAIEGYLALALNEKVATVDSRARDYLEKARASTQHLGQLFQDLLTSAKAEDGRLTSHPTVVEMGEFLEQLTSDLRLIAEKKGLFMEFVSGTSSTAVINATKEERASERVIRPLYFVYVDPDRLREVITNLFDNAVKYTPEGKISIGLTGNDQVAQCYIRDTGPGIPAEDVPHLFQKFYRVDNSATRTIGGTGLGLFICRKIVELYNGRIWVESEVGKGSTFYINFPRLATEKATQLKGGTATGNLPVQPVNPNTQA